MMSVNIMLYQTDVVSHHLISFQDNFNAPHVQLCHQFHSLFTKCNHISLHINSCQIFTWILISFIKASFTWIFTLYCTFPLLSSLSSFPSRDAIEHWVGAVVFYAVVFLSFLAFLLPWSFLMLEGLDPFTWVLVYVFRGLTQVCNIWNFGMVPADCLKQPLSAFCSMQDRTWNHA